LGTNPEQQFFRLSYLYILPAMDLLSVAKD